jgi:acetyl esterase/lipase
MRRYIYFLAVLVTVSLSTSSFAQAKKPPERPEPTKADVVYSAAHARCKLDFWQATSTTPTPLVILIHGGGWTSGDKTGYGTSAIQPYLKNGISVAAINYRLIQNAMEQKVEPPVQAPLHDAARAVQFLRSKAKEWNLDPQRFGAHGGSAGACTILWLACHDDLADPKSTDPVLRQSTRLQAVAVNGAQTSLDPEQLKEWIPNAVYGGHAFGFRKAGGSRPQEFADALKNRTQILPWIKEYSPIELLSSDDPQMFLEYPNQKKPAKLGEQQDDPTHSAIYGLQFAEAAAKKKVQVIVSYPHQLHAQFKNSSAYLISQLRK